MDRDAVSPVPDASTAGFRPDVTPADGAMESLERILGEHWGRAMWIEACRRAGTTPADAMSPQALRRIAGELAEVPGPAGVVGRTLLGQVGLYESLRHPSAA